MYVQYYELLIYPYHFILIYLLNLNSLTFYLHVYKAIQSEVGRYIV